MSIQRIGREKSWTKFIIQENCDFSAFYHTAELLEAQFNVLFTNKVNDFDSLYWDFQLNNCEITLHYNVYLGVSLFPTRMQEASQLEDQEMFKVGQDLKQLLISGRK